jgi:hypothetical protein
MRLIWLPITSRGADSVTVSAPINANLAPPGYYMIHVLDSSLVPSTAKIIKITGTGSGGGGILWSVWTSLSGTGIRSDPILARNADGRLEAFVVGGDTGLWHKWQTTAGVDTWTDWEPLSGSGIINNIAIAQNADGRLEAFAVGSGDGGLWHKWQTTAGSNTWTDWTQLGGSIKGDPTVVRNTDGRLEAFVIDNSDNGLWHKWQATAGSATWTNWESLSIPPVGITSDPTVIQNADGRLEAFLVGGDTGLWH